VIADKGKNILPLLDALSGGAYLDRVRRAAEDFALIYRICMRYHVHSEEHRQVLLFDLAEFERLSFVKKAYGIEIKMPSGF
jgi:hypothetical protein